MDEVFLDAIRLIGKECVRFGTRIDALDSCCVLARAMLSREEYPKISKKISVWPSDGASLRVAEDKLKSLGSGWVEYKDVQDLDVWFVSKFQPLLES